MEKILNFTVIPLRMTYPKQALKLSFDPFDEDEELEDEIDSFKIYACESPDGYVKKSTYGSVSILGNLPDLSIGVEHRVKAIEEYKNGNFQYKILNIKRDKPIGDSSIRLFLSEFCTPKQVEELMREYPDIVNMVINNEAENIDTSKLHGIGEYIINVIKRKILENFVYAELVDTFKGFLDFKTVKALYKLYPSVEQVKAHIAQEPYKTLCKLSRVGFKTADKMLLEFDKKCRKMHESGEEPPILFDFELITSYQRMESCISFILAQNEQDGNTKMKKSQLQRESKNLASQCMNHFNDVLKTSNEFVVIEEWIAIKDTYEAEKYIAEKLIEIRNRQEKKWEYDTSKINDGKEFPLTDEQMSFINNVLNENITLLPAPGGCVDMDTEFFNGETWKKICDYEDGDVVLQYNEDNTSNLVIPTEYHKYPSDELIMLKNESGSVNQVLSLEHNVVFLSEEKLNKKPLHEILEIHNSQKSGFNGKFVNTFEYSGIGIDLTDAEIRVMVATMADGSFMNDTNKCRYNLKKERKQIRLRQLFTDANMEWTEHDWNPKDPKYVNFIAYPPRKDKEFTSYWYNCNQHQLNVILDELFFWDGSIGAKDRKSFSTTVKQSADFVQFCASACGYIATINSNDRVGQEYKTAGKTYIRKSIEYDVHVAKRKNRRTSIGIDSRRNNVEVISKYKTLDGYKYCFTVPSGMLILRRNNRIFITGNSGKTFCLNELVQIIKSLKKSFLLLAPTGKASKRMSEYTNESAYTIHRGLGFTPEGFMYNENYNLPYDVVILDESSMVDIFIFQSLLKAINPEITKLVMIGDIFQIPSVSCGRVFNDIIDTEMFNTTTFTKIFRFLEGGLYNVATNVRNGKIYFEELKDKITPFGTAKDYVLIRSSQENSLQSIVSVYGQLIKKGIDYSDIVITMVMNKGDYGSIVTNETVQKWILNNTVYLDGSQFIKHGDTTYYAGSLIMQTKNDYRIKDVDGDIVPVFNGSMGKVISIDGNKMEVVFDGVRYFYSRGNLENLQLCYCCNVYRMQGSQAPYIILNTPKAHTYMMNKDLLYTAISRTQKRCFHITDTAIIESSLKKSASRDRMTMLKTILRENNKLG